jgi:predicted phosphoribosyltransferase
MKSFAQRSLFFGVGQFYEDFSQTSDEEVGYLLARAAETQQG